MKELRAEMEIACANHDVETLHKQELVTILLGESPYSQKSLEQVTEIYLEYFGTESYIELVRKHLQKYNQEI